MDNILLYIVGAVAGIIGAFKACDWLISLKYKTKDDCERCRNSIFETVNKDRELLTRVDAKLDLLLKHMKISIKE